MRKLSATVTSEQVKAAWYKYVGTGPLEPGFAEFLAAELNKPSEKVVSIEQRPFEITDNDLDLLMQNNTRPN